MFEAQYFHTGDDDVATLYSPWMGRQADNVIITVDRVALHGGTSPTLEVDVFTKNSEESGDGADSGGGTLTAAAGITSKVYSTKSGTVTLKEMVRYRFTLTGGSGVTALFRTLAPVWYNDVDAS